MESEGQEVSGGRKQKLCHEPTAQPCAVGSICRGGQHFFKCNDIIDANRT